ncbi:MAG TPA: type II toxin-antitoxin system PemK/MazF family toxin [Pyrinomonadaceae bacterium]|jgi:mRNA interferase MazF
MPTYSKNEVVLVRYPFTNLAGSKVRPAVVVNAPHASQDVFIVPLTSKVSHLLQGEFVLADWSKAGLNVPSAAKRGLFTLHQTLVVKSVGRLSAADGVVLSNSLRGWLGLP